MILNGLSWKLTDHSVVFEIVSTYCILDSFIDHDGYSISSKGFLPTAVDIMVIWVKFTIPVLFSSLIPRMWTFTFAISCLTASNMLWFMNLTSRFLCNIALYSIGPWFYHQSHPQLGIVFALATSLIISGVISPPISSSILGTYRPREFLFQCSIILPFHTVHGVLKARILKWFDIPFSSGPHSVILPSYSHSYFIVKWVSY